MLKLKNTCAILAAAGVCLAAFQYSASAASITVDQILADNPTGLSGTVSMSLGGTGNRTLTITIVNTSAAGSASGSGGLLSGLAFMLPTGYTISGGSATVASGSSVLGNVNPIPSGNNVSGEWGYGTSAGSSGHFNGLAVNTSVACMVADTDKPFSPIPIDSPAVLEGPEYGLLRTGGDRGGLAAIQNSVVITLSLTGANMTSSQANTFLTTINNGLVVIEFGSPQGAGVPDGGSTLAMLGVALIAGETLRRKLLKA